MSERREVPSPCVLRCALDPEGVCTGCGRTVDEIIAWTRMSADERRKVWARLVSVGRAAELPK